jgi:hypothetical protein
MIPGAVGRVDRSATRHCASGGRDGGFRSEAGQEFLCSDDGLDGNKSCPYMPAPRLMRSTTPLPEILTELLLPCSHLYSNARIVGYQ